MPLVRTALATLITLLAALVLASPAQAQAYRFWGYYQLTDGAWAFSAKGPDQTKPVDGAVEGWRLALSEEPRLPRAVASFDEVCGDTPAEAGQKRVAVVLDYGREADAPAGAGTPPKPRAECAVVDPAATGADVLAAVAEVRAAGGLVCALDGWPAKGCGDQVATVPAAAAAPDEPVTLALEPAETATAAGAGADGEGGGSSAAWVAVVGAAVAAAAGGGIVFAAQRRRSSIGAE